MRGLSVIHGTKHVHDRSARTIRDTVPFLRDPALLIPLVGVGVLVYLAILPLFHHRPFL